MSSVKQRQGRNAAKGPAPTLTPFDVTSLVVGAVVGADIYVVASLGAGLMGPAMLAAWALAGAMAGFIAMSFAQCVAIVPRAGGPYAYAREAFGYFPGFLVGWSLYVAELVTIAIFPVAFVRYLSFFLPELTWWEDVLAKAAFVAFLTITNYFGARVAGKVNDILTVAKLGPLFLLVVLGTVVAILNPGSALSNLAPFTPLGWDALGQTIILAFWAYGGFELAVLPAMDIVDPPRTLPVAIARGMAIVAVLYLSVNAIVVLAMPWTQLAGSTAPLADAMQTIAQTLSLPWWGIGGAIMALGAIISISGADESATLGTSRLAYAMAADGYLPHQLTRLHPVYGTPYVSLALQGVFALIASLIGSFTGLIGLAVFLASIAYLGTVFAAVRLVSRSPRRRLRFAGSRFALLLALGSCMYLISQAGLRTALLGVAALALGTAIYVYFAPKSELLAVKDSILSQEQRVAVVQRALLVAPAYALRRIQDFITRR
ncbi:MAG: amino acid permease [Chloroflexi bacterium]|nr:amino acid permease [Chloroflexota bacterium]